MAGKVKKIPAPRKKANGYKMPAAIPLGQIISDSISRKKWCIGPSVGVGGFGEIYSATDVNESPKNVSQYAYVIKVEPIENGPLFVERNFYLKNGNKEEIMKYMKAKKLSSLGMPAHYGSGVYEMNGEKLRYLVLERYGKDLWSTFVCSGKRFPPTTVFQLGLQMLDVLEYIHSRGYVHADLKGANMLLGLKSGTENQAYLVDFGLASRVTDKEFKPNPKSAHNGTIEYTSRDAHLGVPTMRGDLEILGYNMLQWLVGALPWEGSLKQPKAVQTMKEAFMKDVRASMRTYADVPDELTKFFEYINTMKPLDVPDFAKCRQMFESYLKREGKTRKSALEFAVSKSPSKRGKVNKPPQDTDGNEYVKPKGRRAIKKMDQSEDEIKEETETPQKRKKNVMKTAVQDENEEPEEKQKNRRKAKIVKRKSTEPVIVTKVKRSRSTQKSTPPVKKNHSNIATQTSVEKLKQNSRTVSFDSPISEVIGERKSGTPSQSANSSGDIFEDSFTIKGKKKIKKKLISDEEVTVKRIVKKRVTTINKNKS